MERREDQEIFKKIMYLFMMTVISLSGYDVVKKENPEVNQKLTEITIKLQSLEEKFNLYVATNARLSGTIDVR